MTESTHENSSDSFIAASVPHLERACELLWQAGHPRIAEALQGEVEALVAERDRLAAVLYPKLANVRKVVINACFGGFSLDTLASEIAHPVVEVDRAHEPDVPEQLHHGRLARAGDAAGRPDRGSFHEAPDDLSALLSRQSIHTDHYARAVKHSQVGLAAVRPRAYNFFEGSNAASGYVCERCGMTVHQWGATRGWKHAAGGPQRGCGATPVVAVTREQFEEDLLAEIDTMHRNGRGIDEARDEIMGLRKSGWMESTDA